MSELTTADRLAIQETLHRYCHCLDRGRWEEFAGCSPTTAAST